MDKRVLRCNHLIKKIQNGNLKAIDELFEEFGALFLNMSRKYLFDKDYAEDLLSEVFLELIQTGVKSFDGSKNGLNWMFTIIKRKAYKHNGQGIAEISNEEIEGKSLVHYIYGQDKFTVEDDLLDKAMLKNALSALSDFENELLYYKYWEGLTVREIAKKLDKPRSTVQYNINEIMKKIKKAWDD